MRWQLLYGAFSLGSRPAFDLARLETSDRGLTGSELALFEIARELARRGNEVELQSPTAGNIFGVWEGVAVVSEPRKRSYVPPPFDVAYAWNEPDLLRGNAARLRMVNQQLNDFGYARAGYDAHVGVYTFPSFHHGRHVVHTEGLPRDKWDVVPNGCRAPEWYRSLGVERVPGRVVYCSSPDRGLHLLLSVWSKIRARVPNAHLRVFYDVDRWLAQMEQHPLEPGAPVEHVELKRRAQYIGRALKQPGIETIGCVSRERIALELAAAQVMAYPCDTVRYTEGFSVATLEACSAGAVPVIAATDALGSIYLDSVPMVFGRIGEKLDEYVDLVVRGLTDAAWRNDWIARAQALASQHTWSHVVDRLESVVEEHIA